MKTKVLGLIGIAVMALSAFVWKSSDQGLKVGDTYPMGKVKMTNIDGKGLSLDELKKENGLLVVFSCNTCPFVLAWEDRYNELYDMANQQKIGMVLVNSNEAKRGGDDSLDEMKAHAKQQGYKMPYVVDKNHQLADAFGASSTPHVFLFNKMGQLAYMGAIDDSKDKSGVKQTYLKTALAELGAGQRACRNSQTKAVGCSIKRVGK